MVADPQARSSLITVRSYDVMLDVTGTGHTFRSRAEVRFRCGREGASALADLAAGVVGRMTLNSKELDAGDLHRDGHLALHDLGAENTLLVEAVVPYSESGTGLQRVPAAGDHRDCVYGKGNHGGAALMFCCFDQPDLRAPITLSVEAPAGWCCRANYPVLRRPADGEAGLWRFASTAPLAPYLVALCAGPDNVLATAADRPVPLSVWAPASAGDRSRADAIVDLARQSLHHHGHALGVPYPYPKCDLVFVPGLHPLAYTPPGVGLLQDRLLEPADEEPAVHLACVMTHEMAHAWFGGVIDMRHKADMWIQEALATYLGRTALEAILPGSHPWDDAAVSLPDDAYAADAVLVRRLEARIGRRAVLGGLAALVQRHPHSTVTVDDLERSWSEVGGRDVSGWAAQRVEREAR